jgi:tetratricopeptide (TPR) repeat protein
MPSASKPKKSKPQPAQERDITILGDMAEATVVSGSGNVIYVNGLPVALPAAEPEAQRPLRVLTIVARPLDVNELPEIADAWSLADGLLAVDAPLELRFVRPPTPERLQVEIDAGWDVLHFDGHGTAGGGGFLVLEAEEGLASLLPTDRFIEMLKRAGGPPKLLILSACQSAKGAGKGLAGRLVKEAGVPAVIGFRETVPVTVTMPFVQRLYAGLGAGRTIKESFDAAVSALGETLVPLPPEKQGDPFRQIRAADLPVLAGRGSHRPLCSGQHGAAQIEREPLVGVPSPSESGRFHGAYDANTDPPAGRKALLAEAARALLRGEKLLFLTGVGGIGKTALAAALARRLAWRCPGGVFWVNGADYLESGLGLEDALAPFAAAFGQDFLKLPKEQKRQVVLGYCERLEAPVLWVIDNADVASDEVWRAARALPGRSAALITTRERPEYGGCVIPVEGMAGEEALHFLLQETVRRRNQGLQMDKTTFEAFARIAELLDGHALALMHAAALIADEGLADAEKAVRANPARGDVGRRFDFSYARLAEEERRMLHRMSAFAAGFDARGAEAVCTVAIHERDTNLIPGWEEALRGLVRKSFVEVQAWNGEYHRYRIHPVLREYIRSRAGAALAQEEWRMARYLLAMAEFACGLLGDTERAIGAVRFATNERLNLLAGQEACLRQEQLEAGISFAFRLDDLFERCGRWDSRRQALLGGLEAARKGGGGDYAGLLHNLAVLSYATGDYAEARRLYQESLKIMEQLGDRSGAANTAAQFALLEEREGNLQEALTLIQKAEEAFIAMGAPQREQARKDRERIEAGLKRQKRPKSG